MARGRGAFGDLFRKKRMATGLTLRTFCKEHGLDWGNTSKIERGVLPPPKTAAALEKYARALGLEPDTEAWEELVDLAAACAGVVPERIMGDEDLVAKLPVLFRMMHGKPISREEIEQVIDSVREAWSE